MAIGATTGLYRDVFPAAAGTPIQAVKCPRFPRSGAVDRKELTLWSHTLVSHVS
jgi:hypothetical protein